MLDYTVKNKHKEVFVQSTVYIGSILGLLLITPFADTIGKKKLFVLSQVLLIVGIVSKCRIN
jgi:MFS family permease